MPFRKKPKVKIAARKKPVNQRPKSASASKPNSALIASQKMNSGPRVITNVSQFAMIQKGPSPFPSRFYTNLKYCHLTGLSTPATNTCGIITFRLNGPFDPDQTGVGGQPQYYDQMVAMYAKQRTLGCHFELRFSNPGGVRYWGGYRIRRSTDVSSSGTTYNEIKVQRWTNLQPVSTTGSQVTTMSAYVKPNVIWGDSKQMLHDEEDYASVVGSTPAKEVYLDILAYCPTATAIAAMVELQFNYNIVFTGLKYTVDV